MALGPGLRSGLGFDLGLGLGLGLGFGLGFIEINLHVIDEIGAEKSQSIIDMGMLHTH